MLIRRSGTPLKSTAEEGAAAEKEMFPGQHSRIKGKDAAATKGGDTEESDAGRAMFRWWESRTVASMNTMLS